MTRFLSVARSSGAWPLSLIAIGMLMLTALGCAGSLPPELAGGGGSGGGTGGMMGGTDGGTPPPGCANATSIFMNHQCTALCHLSANAAGLGGGFDMTGTGFPQRLVGGMPVAGNKDEMCAGMNKIYLVAGMQPAQGLFLDKLKATPPCGKQMPSGLGMLAQDEIDCIQKWANNVVGGGPGQ
jgi:hypothetical protein